MSIHNASSGEIYEDKNGDRWIVMWTINEPSVCVQRVQPRYRVDDEMPEKKSGGVNGLMWQGFKRVLESSARKEA